MVAKKVKEVAITFHPPKHRPCDGEKQDAGLVSLAQDFRNGLLRVSGFARVWAIFFRKRRNSAIGLNEAANPFLIDQADRRAAWHEATSGHLSAERTVDVARRPPIPVTVLRESAWEDERAGHQANTGQRLAVREFDVPQARHTFDPEAEGEFKVSLEMFKNRRVNLAHAYTRRTFH